VQDEEDVLDILNNNPSPSIHQIFSATGLSQSVIWCALLMHQLYHFHVQPGDKPHHVQFSHGCCTKVDISQSLCHVLLTNKALFKWNGV
jgi:hypothetical protein